MQSILRNVGIVEDSSVSCSVMSGQYLFRRIFMTIPDEIAP